MNILNKKVARIYVGKRMIVETTNTYKAYKFYDKLVAKGVKATFSCGTQLNNY